MAKWLYNDTDATITRIGQDITADTYYQIPEQNKLSWSNDDDVLSDIVAGNLIVSSTNASGGHIAGSASAINYLKEYDPNPIDSDNAKLSRLKITKTGWGFQCNTVEFTTSKLSSVYHKKADGTDWGYCTIKFYDDEDTELTDQNDIDSDCVKTIMQWKPTVDIEVIGGGIFQTSAPTSATRAWFYHPVSGHEFCTGGIDLQCVGTTVPFGIDGRAPKLLPYVAGQDYGTLKMIVRHSAGYEHKVTLKLEIFRA